MGPPDSRSGPPPARAARDIKAPATALDASTVQRDLDIARLLAAAGARFFCAYPDPEGTTESGRATGYRLPGGWEDTSGAYIDAWKPGMALCMVTGHGLDVVDEDPRNGGDLASLDGVMPEVYGVAATPSGGTHSLIASLGVRKAKKDGIDVQAGDKDGAGRGFAFVAPTVRKSKVTGELVAYRWIRPPEPAQLKHLAGDKSGAGLAELVRSWRTPQAGSHLFQQPGPERKHAGPIPDGERHDALVSYAGWLRARNFPLPEAEACMRLRLADCEQPPAAREPVTEAEAIGKLHDVYSRYGPGDPAAEHDGGPGEEQPPSRLDQLRAALLDSDGLDNLPAPEPLIDGLLYRDSLAWLHGKPGHGKSLLALDWACCIAAGLPWLCRPVTGGAVLYVIAEGATGLRARVRAWEDRARQKTAVRFLPVAVQLLQLGEPEAIAALAAELACVLVVLDTQAHMSVGADENSSQDMGRLVEAADKIRMTSGACVQLVHHEARAGENMRGSTALEGAATTILRAVKDGSRLELTNPKQKDAAEADPVTLWVVPRLQSVVIADKPDGPTLDLRADSENKILTALLDLFGTTGAAATTLREATGLSKSTFHWALNRLVKDGLIQNLGSRTRTCYALAQDALPAEVQQVQQGPSPTGPMSNGVTRGNAIGLGPLDHWPEDRQGAEAQAAP